jgi:death-on-curing protein
LPGIRDIGSIESAIERPYTGYYKKIEEKAAALVESVANNHGFVDGNKRTALILLVLLLAKSGYRLAPVAGENLNQAVEQMIVSVARRKMNKIQIINWLKPRIRRSI